MNPHDNPHEKKMYKVEVTHIHYYSYNILAESEDDASDLALEQYENEKNPILFDEELDTKVSEIS